MPQESVLTSIFLQFEDFLREAGKMDVFDNLVYNYRLKEYLPNSSSSFRKEFSFILNQLISNISTLNVVLRQEWSLSLTDDVGTNGNYESRINSKLTGGVEIDSFSDRDSLNFLSNNKSFGQDFETINLEDAGIQFCEEVLNAEGVGQSVQASYSSENDFLNRCIQVQDSFFTKNTQMDYQNILPSNDLCQSSGMADESVQSLFASSTNGATCEDLFNIPIQQLESPFNSLISGLTSSNNEGDLNNLPPMESPFELGNEKENDSIENSESTETESLPFLFCDKCNYVFRTNADFDNHQCVKGESTDEDLHPFIIKDISILREQKKFICSICMEEFRVFSRISVHFPKCSDSGPYYCELCTTGTEISQTVFNSLRTLNRHKKEEHAAVASFICNECGHSFKHKCSLQKHKMKHGESKKVIHQCDLCEKTFQKQIHLTNHRIKDHELERNFLCQFCGHRFSTQASLSFHIEHSHSGEKKFPCQFCPKIFTRKDKLKFHQVVHTGEKSFICEICGKSFSRKIKLEDHHRRHKGEKKYTCTIEGCTKAYSSNHDLKVHLTKIHLI